MKSDYALLPTPPATAQSMCDAISEMLPDVISGSIRFWGEWFGGRKDNWHSIVRCEAEGNTLQVWFNEGERLTVENPICLEIGKNVFAINGADRILWEWHYYGLPASPETLYFEEFVRTSETLIATTNMDWFEPDLRPSRREKAVEILR